jgi:serine kinase of HPr protein (carbohydrate metabolism regulator)
VTADPPLIHATSVAIDGHGVLITGRSGTGKSDLALRLIDRGAVLVSDDQTLLRVRDGVLYAYAPAAIRGRIEVRGIGILEMAQVEDVACRLAVAIEAVPERLPPDGRLRTIAGVALPEIGIAALEASAAIKVELALARVIGDSANR